MCGINFFLDKNGKGGPAIINRMTNAIRYRGPDQTKTKSLTKNDTTLYLGANRLRITDQNPQSDQPFQNGPGNRFLLFNGEIYNYFEIKNKLLRKGHAFISDSDTETIFNYLIEKGPDAITEMHGMFAIVFIDWNKNLILTARDPWGMKPLYFYNDDDFLIISSEIKGIQATGLVEKKLNEDQIANYLKYRYTLPPYTLFQNVFQFNKGVVYKYRIGDKNFEQSTIRNSASLNAGVVNSNNSVALVEERLIDSLIDHTNASVPVGLFLSGGIDSTLLLALCTRHHIPLQYIFSVVNKQSEKRAGTEDYLYSRMAARLYGRQLEVLEIDDSILIEIDEYIDTMDHPIGDGAGLLTLILSRKAKQKTGVVLSGAGADELFAGYNRHIAFYKYLRNYEMIRTLLPALRKFNSLLPGNQNIPFKKSIQLWRKFLNRIDKTPESTFDHFISLDTNVYGQKTGSWPIFSKQEFISQNFNLGLEKDRNEYLPEDVLAISDRTSMLCSLEMRMPYLDWRLCALVNSLDPLFLIKNGRKWILRELLKKYDGKPFADRPKEGFGMPFGSWIRNEKYRHLTEQLNDKNQIIWQYCDFNKCQSMIKAHLSGKIDFSQEIWSILIITLWIKRHFK